MLGGMTTVTKIGANAAIRVNRIIIHRTGKYEFFFLLMASYLLGRPLFQLNKWMIFQQFARYVCQIHVIVGIVGTLANHQIIAGRWISKIRHTMILGIHFVRNFIANSTCIFTKSHHNRQMFFFFSIFFLFFFLATRVSVTLRQINEFVNKLFVIQINRAKKVANVRFRRGQ